MRNKSKSYQKKMYSEERRIVIAKILFVVTIVITWV